MGGSQASGLIKDQSSLEENHSTGNAIWSSIYGIQRHPPKLYSIFISLEDSKGMASFCFSAAVHLLMLAYFLFVLYFVLL